MRTQQTRGFTLIELMIVVAIIGILAATAIPAFQKYVLRAKTTEASLNLRKQYDGVVAYVNTEHVDVAGTLLPRRFPNPPPVTPPNYPSLRTLPGCKYPANSQNWSGPEWSAMGFEIDGPYFYYYHFNTYSIAGTDLQPGDRMELHAHGDLNCDGGVSTFGRWVYMDASNAVYSTGLFIQNELQ